MGVRGWVRELGAMGLVREGLRGCKSRSGTTSENEETRDEGICKACVCGECWGLANRERCGRDGWAQRANGKTWRGCQCTFHATANARLMTRCRRLAGALRADARARGRNRQFHRGEGAWGLAGGVAWRARGWGAIGGVAIPMPPSQLPQEPSCAQGFGAHGIAP